MRHQSKQGVSQSQVEAAVVLLSPPLEGEGQRGPLRYAECRQEQAALERMELRLEAAALRRLHEQGSLTR